MIRATVRFLPAIVPLILGACSSAGGYPSLAQRDVERVSGTAKPVVGDTEPAAPVLPPASTDLLGRLDGLVSTAQEADRQFVARRDGATSAVASATGAGAASDRWASAQIALGKLETSRSAAVAALAELDTLYADARDAAPLEVSPGVEAIARAREQVSEIVARENGVIAALAARLES